MAIAVGELGVPEEVVLGERLLDQQQVELVEVSEVGEVVARVGGVGVDLQRRVRPDQPAHSGDRFEVAARLDLQLDADVAVLDVAADRVEQLADRGVDADADATRDPRPPDAEEFGERAPGGAQLGVEDGHLERRLGHRVATNGLEHAGDRRGVEVVHAGESWRQHLPDHERCAVDVLRRVRRLVAGDALPPALGDGAVVLDLGADEQDAPAGLHAEARAERRDEGEPDLAQLADSRPHWCALAPMRVSERQRANDQQRPAWPGNAIMAGPRGSRRPR